MQAGSLRDDCYLNNSHNAYLTKMGIALTFAARNKDLSTHFIYGEGGSWGEGNVWGRGLGTGACLVSFIDTRA